MLNSKRKKITVSLIIFCSFFIFSSVALAGPTLEMWMQNYGPREKQMEIMDELIAEFNSETGIDVEVNIVNWENAFNKWTLVSRGGEAPDVGDMFWLYSNVRMGQGQHGPRPLDEYEDMLELDRFPESALDDVTFQDHVYGVPWRVDVRPLAYRSDLLEEEGYTEPPSTWEELVEYGKKLTKDTDDDGEIDQWGVGFWGENFAQEPLAWIWMAGGDITSSDGMTATLNTPEVKDAMQFVRDLIYKHKVAPESVIEPTYEGEEELINGHAAIIPFGSTAYYDTATRRAPDIADHLKAAPPLKGKTRAAYMGGGYFGVQYATEHLEESVKWVSFLGRKESQLKLSEMGDMLPVNKKSIQADRFQEHTWYSGVADSVEHGHSSQNPSPAFQQIMTEGRGGIMYDLWLKVIENEEPLDEILSEQEEKMQELIDKAQ